MTNESSDVGIELDLGNFDTSRVTNMLLMFGFSHLTNLYIESFDTSNVTNMAGLFEHARLEKLDLSFFNTTNTTKMDQMFAFSSVEYLDISNFDFSNYIYESGFLFEETSIKKLIAKNIKLPSDTTFLYADNIGEMIIDSWDLSNINDIDLFFRNMPNSKKISLKNLDLSKFENLNGIFDEKTYEEINIMNWNTSNILSMSYMFGNLPNLQVLNIDNLDTTSVTDMSNMFYGMSGLTSLDISSFNTSNITDMSSMFEGCTILNKITYGSNFVYKNNASVENMFESCPANKPTDASWEGVLS